MPNGFFPCSAFAANKHHYTGEQRATTLDMLPMDFFFSVILMQLTGHHHAGEQRAATLDMLPMEFCFSVVLVQLTDTITLESEGSHSCHGDTGVLFQQLTRHHCAGEQRAAILDMLPMEFYFNVVLVQLTDTITLESKGQPRLTCGRWNPHHNCAQIATANETTIRGWDLRSKQ